MIRVAETANPLHAQLLVGLLEGQGIRACVQGEALWGARGELPFTTSSAPSIWVVDETDAARAREIIAAHDAKPNPETCFRCGYDLRGLGEPRCPECGTAFRRESEWICGDCGETLATQFTHCWKCGADRGRQPSSPPAPRLETDHSGRTENCILCHGTGRVSRRLAPGIAFAVGLFLLFGSWMGSIQMIIGIAMAVVCFLWSAKLRTRTCDCRDDWMEEKS